MTRTRDVDEVIERMSNALDRLPFGDKVLGVYEKPATRDARRRRAERRRARVARKARRMMLTVAAVIVATIVWGVAIGPIGVGTLMLLVLATICALIALGTFPREEVIAPVKLATARPAVLPAQVDQWLDAKRRALPALAAPKVDAISAQLAALGPQLAAVPADDPTALELNRLLGKHLPELVDRYEKVAPAQRKTATMPGGPTIERQLVDGLGLIEAELARVNDDLGKTDRDAFAVQGKFLETRYGKDGTLS